MPARSLRRGSHSVRRRQLATSSPAVAAESRTPWLDYVLTLVLQAAGFTGRIEEQLEARLGRKIDSRLAELGRLLFFDPIGALHDDNACAGCHAPSAGMGDTQIDRDRHPEQPAWSGPRASARATSAARPPSSTRRSIRSSCGTAASRRRPAIRSTPRSAFTSRSRKVTRASRPNDPVVTHLLIAQAHIPPTELVEVAGFTGTFGKLEPRFAQFDDGLGGIVPPPDASGFRNEPIRRAVLDRLNASAEYRRLFGERFPRWHPGAPIDFTMFGRAIAEFEFSLVARGRADRSFARGDRNAMTPPRSAARSSSSARAAACAATPWPANPTRCSATSGCTSSACRRSRPCSASDRGNVVFDGPGEDEDFGLEQVTLDSRDRYKFRTSPLRNLALQPAYFHNGAFTRLEDAVRYHLDAQAMSHALRPGGRGCGARPALPARADRACPGAPRSATRIAGAACRQRVRRPGPLSALRPARRVRRARRTVPARPRVGPERRTDAHVRKVPARHGTRRTSTLSLDVRVALPASLCSGRWAIIEAKHDASPWLIHRAAFSSTPTLAPWSRRASRREAAYSRGRGRPLRD